jgi:hypothetical protein
MTKLKKQSSSRIARTGDSRAIKHFEQGIAGGRNWYIALLEAIGMWHSTEETDGDHTYHYLIDDEAFDWLLLADRLCQTLNGLLPEDERNALLFHGKPPIDLPAEQFRELIGDRKYHQYLNYFYGITVEEVVILAVQEEIRKKRRLFGDYKEPDPAIGAYRQIYGATKTILLRRFRKEKGYSLRKSTRLTELKEFTYWLFKYRIKQNDKAKVASDTKKALDWLKNHGFTAPDRRKLKPERIEVLPSI